MPELAGYLDRWSERPGQCIAVHLSCEPAADAVVDLVRLGLGAERADARGIAMETVSVVAPQRVALAPQRADAGSYAEMPGLDALKLAQGALALLVQPWSPGAGEQTVLALEAGGTELAVGIDASSRWTLRSGGRTVQAEAPVRLRQWVALLLCWDAAGATLRVAGADGRTRAVLSLAGAAPAWVLLRLAGRRDGAGIGAHFDGRLERPVLWPQAVAPDAAHAALWQADGLPGGALACWDFARDMDGMTVTDLGPHGLHGRLLQGPKRAVRGARWRGEVFDWRADPAQYAAVHFHREDLLDAGWAASARLTLPEELPSGAYAVRVRAEGTAGEAHSLTRGQVHLPLFVRATAAPAPGSGTVAVVFPTFTYLAYANDRCALFGHNPEVLASRAIELEPADVLLSQHPEWGLSLYDTHDDGSGVALASRRRPIPGFQPDQHAWQAGEGSGRWNYPADLLLVEWLQREGIAWHALTDEDLHEGGAAALAPYRVVLTGNHPEYTSPQMLAAYRGFLDGGGRLMYLGGNGFYWKVACHASLPGVLELRRAEDGNRSWAEEPGEYYHAFDGGYGGLWRRTGVPPQSWLGVGYAGQGFRRSAGFRRLPDSDRPQAAFVFDGVEAREFGLRGAIGNGCAGVEVDRRDEALGSDPCGLLLATSLPFDATYLVANEEMLVSRPTLGADLSASVRADLVLQAAPKGGAVFSTGSIAWIGGLAASGGDAAVQRITRNVLARFLQPAPLELPTDGHAT